VRVEGENKNETAGGREVLGTFPLMCRKDLPQIEEVSIPSFLCSEGTRELH